VFNVGGGSRVALNAALDILVNEISGTDVDINFKEPVKGDVMHTYADIRLAQKELGYSPKADLEEGISREIDWLKSIRKTLHSG
ncbi:MAG: UDP-glucose 4-epimerase, partial [Candidatus Latescibacterota bacterium]